MSTPSSASSSAQPLRSRFGCWTCRFRKKKCDEVQPMCGQCRSLRIECEPAINEQPAYMRDPEAAAAHRQVIKAQMGKCTRRRRKKHLSVISDDPDGLSPTSTEEIGDEVVEIAEERHSLLAIRPLPRESSIEAFEQLIADNIYRPPVHKSLADEYLMKNVNIQNPIRLALFKHYMYDVCPYTYRGMSQQHLTQIMRESFIPRCRAKPNVFEACVSAGAAHLVNTAKAENDLELPRLEREAALHENRAFAGLVTELGKVDRDSGDLFDILGSIIVLTNTAINSGQDTWQTHLRSAADCVVKLDALTTSVPANIGQRFIVTRVVHLDIVGACLLDRIPLLCTFYAQRPPPTLAIKETTGILDEAIYILSDILVIRHQLVPIFDLLHERDTRIQYLLSAVQSDFITALYLHAARVILHATLIGGLWPDRAPFPQLLENMKLLLDHPHLCLANPSKDRAIAWPLLVAGTLAIKQSDKDWFVTRLRRSMDEDVCGILRQVLERCAEVWRRREKDGPGVEVGWWNVQDPERLTLLV